MSNLIELITQWETFQEGQNKSVEEFCRYYLAQRQVVEQETYQNRQRKADELLRVMGRITSTSTLYYRTAMAKPDLPSADSLNYLSGLRVLGEVRKTELINYLFVEYTTGMEAISRLIDNNYISERLDQTDRRAKLISLTTKGKQQLHSSDDYLSRVSQMIFARVNDDTITLCLTLLKPIEERQNQLLPSIRNKEFKEMYYQAISSDNL